MNKNGGSQRQKFRALKGRMSFGEKFEPPEAPRHRGSELLKGGHLVVWNPRIPKFPNLKIQESIRKKCPPSKKGFGQVSKFVAACRNMFYIRPKFKEGVSIKQGAGYNSRGVPKNPWKVVGEIGL